MKPSRRRLKRIAAGVCLALVLIGLAAVAGLYWSQSLLMIEHQPAKADVIILLGGEPTYRPPRTLEVYKLGLAPGIIVSGDGDSDSIVSWLVGKGMPETAIRVESKSHNTRQNAEFTVRLLRDQKAKRVILVTSWFHSRRALACFRKEAPEMEFISLPTVTDLPKAHWPSRYERGSVLWEYVKLAGYLVRYGVWPG